MALYETFVLRTCLSAERAEQKWSANGQKATNQ